MKAGSKSYIELIVSLIGAILVAGVAGWLLFRYAIPQYSFRFYLVIPLYFIVLGIVMSIVMWVGSRRLAPRKMVHVYMIMRGVKLLLTLGGIYLFYRLVGEQMVEFCLTAAAFYFIYLFVETYVYYRFEKMNKHIH
jgi:hypothetical protein